MKAGQATPQALTVPPVWADRPMSARVLPVDGDVPSLLAEAAWLQSADYETTPLSSFEEARAALDHEFGTSFLEKDQQGWDWLSLQLADGRELMIYQLRRGDGLAPLVVRDADDRRDAGRDRSDHVLPLSGSR